MFGLSKAQMLQEPIEDVERNILIETMLSKKQEQKRAMMEKIRKARSR